MKTRSYGTVRMSVNENGENILHLPKALVRDLHLKAGDYVSLRAQKGPALHLRFFRKVKGRWRQLLPNGMSRALLRRPVTDCRLEIMATHKSPTPRQRRRIEGAITTQIRHYSTCLELTRHLDHLVFRAGMAAFKSEATFALWLCAPCRALGDKIPLRVMRSASGREHLIQVLRSIAQCNYL